MLKEMEKRKVIYAKNKFISLSNYLSKNILATKYVKNLNANSYTPKCDSLMTNT